MSFLRVSQILGNPKKGVAPILPVSPATWWAGVKSGRFPKPIKLSPGCTVWLKSDIDAMCASIASGGK